MEEEKSSSTSTTVSGSLTERRGLRRPSSKPKTSTTGTTAAGGATIDEEDELSRTLTGLDLQIRNVIPTPPVRPGPFNLDQALVNLESQLTGITAGQSGLTQPPVASFPPTNFYIQWPPPSHVVSEEQRRLNGGGNYKNNWISPRDLLMEKTLKPKTVADFPTELVIHTQKHQPGLMGFQGDIPLEAVQAMNPLSPIPGGAAAKHFTGRILNDFMSEKNNQTFTGAKPKTAGEKNRNVGPGSYEGPMTAAVLARSTSTFKPKPPKRFDELGLLQGLGPAPGSYSATAAIAPRIPALHFGGTQKTLSRAGHMSNQTGAIGTDIGGPGYYEKHEPKFGGEPTSQIFVRAARFSDPSGAATTGVAIGAPVVHAPGPGQYNITAASVGAIGASSARDCVSFSARGGGGSAAAAAIGFKRSSGPAVGSYNPSDGLDIGSSTLSFTGNSVQHAKPLHKFSSTPRFDYHSRPHPLYALVISSSKARAEELARNFKPDLSAYKGRRREEILAQQKAQRDERARAAGVQRQHLRAQHLEQLDRIIHADLYRQKEREEKAVREFDLFVKRGWLFYVALASRMHVMKENIRRVRTAKNLRLLTTNAARTIVTYARRWGTKAHAKKVKRSAEIILRALRRNVVRASLRRKRRAVKTITILLLNQLNKTRALHAIAQYKSYAAKIQRCVRNYLARKHAATHHLLLRQWNAAENLLATKYKTQEGEKSFEKIKKKGLLIKNMTVEQQKAKIIKEIPFDLIDERLKLSMIEEDYMLRLRAYFHHKYEWLAAKRKHDGLPEYVSLIDRAIAARAKKAKEQPATAIPAVSSSTAASSTAPSHAVGQSPSAAKIPTPQQPTPQPTLPPPQSATAIAYAKSAAAAALALTTGYPAPPPFDPNRPPHFPRLVTPLRLYWLITTAQARQAAIHAETMGTSVLMDPDLKKQYKKIIGSILRAIQAKEAKEKKAKERARLEREKEKEEAAREAAAVQAAMHAKVAEASRPLPTAPIPTSTTSLNQATSSSAAAGGTITHHRSGVSRKAPPKKLS